MPKNYINQIVSGGQTGVDRAALDAAIKLNIPHGGWCPKGSRAEDGKISSEYNLKETLAVDYEQRTEWNVRDSDGTLIILSRELAGGTLYTLEMAKKYNKPYYLIDLSKGAATIDNVVNWILFNQIRKLNVAGPRASQSQGIYGLAFNITCQLISELATI